MNVYCNGVVIDDGGECMNVYLRFVRGVIRTSITVLLIRFGGNKGRFNGIGVNTGFVGLVSL